MQGQAEQPQDVMTAAPPNARPVTRRGGPYNERLCSGGTSPMSDIADEVERIAHEAEAAFQERANGTLDYSSQSLDVIEEMLDEAVAYVAEMDAKSVDQLVQYAGCYIFQVARRAHGGKFYWHEGRDQPVLVVGEPAYRIALLTWDRVRQRLSGDPADNIPFFYAGFDERVRQAVPGDDALYV